MFVQLSQSDDFALFVLNRQPLLVLDLLQQPDALLLGILLHPQLVSVDVQLPEQLLIAPIQPGILFLHLFDLVLEPSLQLCGFGHFVACELSLEVEQTRLGLAEEFSVQCDVLLL